MQTQDPRRRRRWPTQCQAGQPLLLIATALLCSALSLASHAAEPPLLTVIGDAYPPHFLIRADTEAEGPAAARVRDFLRFAGFEAQFLYRPWARVLATIESEPMTLAMPMTRSPAREDKYHWLLPLYSTVYVLTTLADRLVDGTPSLARLRSGAYRVACSSDSYQCHLVEQLGFPPGAISKVTGDAFLVSVKMLQAGRVDFIVGQAGMLGRLARRHRLPDKALVELPQLSHEVTDYLVASLRMEAALLARLDEAAAAYAAQAGQPD